FLFGGDDVDKKVAVLSGGEKTRLSLCKLLLEPYNLLLLDEPTNHLDIKSKEILKQALMEYDGTLLIVSHDRDFLNGLTNRIYEIRNEQISIHHFGIKEFLDYRKKDSIVDLEHNSNPNKKRSTEKNSKKKNDYVNRKDREKNERKLKSRIARLEGEIAELESKLKKLDQEIMNLDYSDKETTEQTLGEYNSIKKKLDQCYQDWETASDAMDAIQ
ncbi:MAG TPA: glycosyl transferase family 2, partial [Flavobacteriales bacterium]|nr:glycosyl transferase family 2 [Flavobacteriales bacterium]